MRIEHKTANDDVIGAEAVVVVGWQVMIMPERQKDCHKCKQIFRHACGELNVLLNHMHGFHCR